MTAISFHNISKTAVSEGLQKRLSDAAPQIREVLAHEGIGPAQYGDIVAVLLVPDDPSVDMRVSAVRKPALRQFIKNLQRESGHRLPIPESTLARCEASLPYGALRALYISSESCGSMQLLAEDLNVNEELREAIAESEAYLSESEAEGEALNRVMATLSTLPKAQALQVLLEAEKRAGASHAKLRELRDRLTSNVHDVVGKLPDFKDRWTRVLERIKKAVIPPDAKTANNVEATLMAASYVFEPVSVGTGLTSEETSFLIGHFSLNEPLVTKLLTRMSGSLRGHPFSGTLQDFGTDWMHAGFPKLEVGHKLAATLAMTDVPDDIEVLAPWPAWSLVIPPGLFGDDPAGKHLARLWCVGAEVRFVVNSSGEIIGPTSREEMLRDSGPGLRLARAACVAMDSLVRGACLALSNPDDYKRHSFKDTVSRPSKKQRDGEPDFSVSRFMLSAPVQIDLRQVLLDTLMGKKKHAVGGGSPTVQFFVRGHWRNQAHGPGRTLRKTIRIEGFWKGPEEGRVLLRNYKVKDAVQEEAPTVTEANSEAGG